MSSSTATKAAASTQRLKFQMIAATILTYAVAIWIIRCNPYSQVLNDRLPLTWSNLPPLGTALVNIFVVFFGKTPFEALTRLAIVAVVVQVITVLGTEDEDLEPHRCRALVFWRAMEHFWSAIEGFLSGRDVAQAPSTALTEYERVTVRYYFVKLIFVPIMAGFLYANIQELISMAQISVPVHYTVQGIVQTYMFAYMGLMVVDVIWFALCSMVETKRFSPIVTVDPYASGWIVSMICYPPLNSQAGQFFPWMPPNFPFEVTSPGTALVYAVLGILLWLAYVIADFSFGLKAGNLTYRGLVDKGAYRIIRHPMYTTKILAWTVFTIPALGFHIGHNAAGIPFVACNYSLLWAVIAWACIYASRAFTEERYLLTYPEYREYCTRVRYRFIPGIL